MDEQNDLSSFRCDVSVGLIGVPTVSDGGKYIQLKKIVKLFISEATDDPFLKRG